MNYPSINEYKEAIKFAEDNFDQLKNLRPVLDEEGNPVMTSGNFAVVFKMKDEQTGKLHAVKCFLREQEGRAEAYRQIAEELEYVSSTFLTPIKYLDKELFVDTNASDDTEFPVLLMDWVEGETLDKYIRKHLDNQYELLLLAYQFSRLAMWLMPQPFAHGDLKPDNILVKSDGTLVLVDYDGMYVPAMKGQKARELGSPDFRHPSRTETDFDEHIDDFSLASILLSLKAISLQPSFLKEYGASDRLLFSEKDYRNLSESEALNALRPLMQNAELISLYSLFILAISQSNLSQVSFRLFNLNRPNKSLYEEENLSTEWQDRDSESIFYDEYGVRYSVVGNRLLGTPHPNTALAKKFKKEYVIRKGTKIIGHFAFSDHRQLLSVKLPNSICKIGKHAFYKCYSLSYVNIPNGVVEIGDVAFAGCNIKTLSIPDSVIRLGVHAFSGCSSLTSVSIGRNLKEIGVRAFSQNSNLVSIVVNESNKFFDSRNNCNAIIRTNDNIFIAGCSTSFIPIGIIRIDDYAFWHCDKLKRIDIPNDVLSIGKEAFAWDENLTTVSLPMSIESIEDKIFIGCTNLESIIIPKGTKTKFEHLLPNYAEILVEQVETPPSKWTPVGDKYTLEEIWDAEGMPYEDIIGDEAEITVPEFADGSISWRISVPLKDGQIIELKAGKGIQNNYDEGDKVKVSLIYGQELKKAGLPSIVRYDVWESEDDKIEYLAKRDA